VLGWALKMVREHARRQHFHSPSKPGWKKKKAESVEWITNYLKITHRIPVMLHKNKGICRCQVQTKPAHYK